MALVWNDRPGCWCHHADVGELDLRVWCVHSSGIYAVGCYPIITSREIAADTMEQAKSAAVAMSRERLNELIKELDQ